MRKISMNPRSIAKWLPLQIFKRQPWGKRIVIYSHSFVIPDHSLARAGLDTGFYHVLSGKVYKLWRVLNVFLFLLELMEFSCLYGKS